MLKLLSLSFLLFFKAYFANAASSSELGAQLKSDFKRDFQFMATMTERCTSAGQIACEFAPDTWQRNIQIAIFSGDRKTKSFQAIKEATDSFVTQVSPALPFTIELLEQGIGNILIFQTTDTVNRFVIQNDLHQPISEYQNFLKSDLRCFGSAYVYEDGEIFHANVIVKHYLSDHDVRNCIFEELFNVLGIYSDPPGLASTLEKYQLEKNSDGQYALPGELIKMLEVYYQLAKKSNWNQQELLKLIQGL